MPAIADLGKGAGKLPLLTTIIAYGSTLFSGFTTYFATSNVFQSLLSSYANQTTDISEAANDLAPYFLLPF